MSDKQRTCFIRRFNYGIYIYRGTEISNGCVSIAYGANDDNAKA